MGARCRAETKARDACRTAAQAFSAPLASGEGTGAAWPPNGEGTAAITEAGDAEPGGHQAGHRKRRDAAVALPLAVLMEWELHVDCGADRCPRGRRYPLAELAKFHAGRTLSEALRGMRCRGCGMMPRCAALLRRSRGRGDEDDWLPLVGPGVY